MRELLTIIDAWARDGVGMARAVVIRTYGSAPRREGATMLWAEDGRISGSVSGGCVEGATAERLAEAHASGEQRVVRFGISDAQAWDVGLACGGTVDVLVQPSVPEAVLSAARASARHRRAASAVITALPPGSPPSSVGASQLGPAAAPSDPITVEADGLWHGSSGDDRVDAALVVAALSALSSGTSSVVEAAGGQFFVEAFPARPRLVVVGAVTVAAALVDLARALGYETVVVDGRPAFATSERFPDVDELVVGWPDEVADAIELGPDDAVAVLSHDPKFDDPAISAALRRGCRYVGAIGSRKTQRARRERLLAAGLEPGQLDRLYGPIGLDLGGREPGATALAIMAEIVAVRYEGSGRPMRDVVSERGGEA